ncbi:hypothetical protein O9993_21480 [Vibrio lentus]|nr:hypothetical protein [Vibrio lentus]
MTISVEGQDINEIETPEWFRWLVHGKSRHFTEVEIHAFNEDGDMIIR